MIITRINQIIFLFICIFKIKEVTIGCLVNSLVLPGALVLWVIKEIRPSRNWTPGARNKYPSSGPVSHSTISMSLLSLLIR